MRNNSCNIMASFLPNPNDENEPWIEKSADGLNFFRIWHVMFFCFSIILIVVTLICCCIKIRIPRTKQEIDADYQRKKIAKKFREKLKCIENQAIHGIDLKKALELIQHEIENETKGSKENLCNDKMNIEVIVNSQPLPSSQTLSDKICTIINSNKVLTRPQNL